MPDQFYRPQPPQPSPSDQMYSSIMALLQTLHANQLNMLGMLNKIIKQETTMAVDMTALQAEIANNSTVEASVLALLQQITSMLTAIPPSSDPTTQAAIDAAVATLTQNDQALAAAVVANTPATPQPASARR